MFMSSGRKESGILQIDFAVSNNSGESFSSAIVVDDTPNQNDITPVLASYGNAVYVGYDCNGSSCVVSSNNNGESFGKSFQYATGPEPQLAAYGSNAYAVADSFSRNSMTVGITHNDGNTWSILNIPNGAGAEPWISADNSNVLISWETKNTDSVVGVSTSSNSGESFSKALVISNILRMRGHQ